MTSVLMWAWLGLVALVPLPLGANNHTAVSLLFTAFSLLVAIYLLLPKRAEYPPALNKWVYIPVLLVFLLGIIQTFMPASPPSWGNLVPPLGIQVWWVSTLNVVESFYGLLRWAIYGFAFYLAYVLTSGSSSKAAKRLIRGLSVAGAIYALYGIYMVTSGEPMLFLWEKKHYLKDATGTFINRNTYATYAGVAALCSLTWLWQRVYLLSQQNWRKRYKHITLFFLENATFPNLLPLVCFVANVSGLLLSHSRAGGGAFLLGLIVMAAGLYNIQEKKAKAYVKYVFLGVLLPLTVWLFTRGGGQTLERMSSFSESVLDRMGFYTITLARILEEPWSFAGLGNFETLYHTIRPLETPSWMTRSVDKVHNTYLQLAVEVGFWGLMLILISWLAVIAICWHGFRFRKKNRELPLLGLSATVLVAAHALVDFSLEIPAFTVIYLSVLGMAMAQSYSSSNTAMPSNMLYKKFAGGGCLVLAALGLFLYQATAYQLRYVVELRQLRKAPFEMSVAQLSEILSHQQRAERLLPLPKVMNDGALLNITLAEKTKHRQEFLLKQAQNQLEKQAVYAPYEPFVWMQLAHVLRLQHHELEKLPNLLEISIRTGTAEPFLLAYRLQLGQGIWHMLNVEQRDLVQQQYQLLKAYNSKKAEELALPMVKNADSVDGIK
ncbi:MAG: O-antigen ligase family protein [Alphaproteobacteria bacterium]|nr:O-antigen ligase family protein [Alphaproteobacteria bacterium]